MPDWLEIPLHEASGRPTGETVRVPSPPPAMLSRADEHAQVRFFELRRVEECVRFGCGCVREEHLRYVRVG